MSLSGKVAIVTGASRGIGKGIALQLGEAGATVYITGRTVQSHAGAPAPGSLNETAQEVERRGGKCIPVACDHSLDSDIDSLFERARGVPFWKLPPTFWDEVNNVGLRNHYICSVKAAQLMTERKSGLIINVSSIGGLTYLFNVPYGVGKAACDRMAADCAVELKKHKVAFVSLWPGAVKTELVKKYVLDPMEARKKAGGSGDDGDLERSASRKAEVVENMFANGETVEFSGKCVVALAKDPNIMKKSGRVLLTGELGSEYSLVDIDGRQHLGIRSVKELLKQGGWTKTAEYIPQFLAIPRFVVNAYFGRF
ncbi:Dehydrogenase/reductase SDR family member 1 [Hypsibius exemplaris]|uniref:Dehydrogenase/reductase SDR family member 1 n=1 Tax=Hypsibius exemplaris TaxID=2072580 RepID=A0A1W0WZ16_HYPEX|nr:Dehydrogenase/reductase SDR family member 1 [Hypsibius exemplaris]